MVKLHTRKKFVKKNNPATPKELQNVTNVATDYIKQWTRNELGKLQQSKDTSICIPVKNGYKIGLYNLRVYPNKICEVRDHNDELVHNFDNKIHAVLYTIYYIKKKYYLSDEILLLDKEINKNYTDVLSLRRGIELSCAAKDFNKADIKQAKLEIAEKRLEVAREKLAKIHRTAKFNKVWE